MVKLLRGGMNHPRGGNYPQHGRGFPRFPIQPPPMMNQYMPLSREHFQRQPPPYRPSLPFSRGRPFPGPPPHFSQHPIPTPRMGPLTPRAELPISFNGRSYPARPMLPHYSMPPGPFRGTPPPHRFPHKISEQLSIIKSVPVKRLGVINDKTKQKQRRNPKKERSEEAEINKPWMTEKLKIEISKKHKLYHEAKEKNIEQSWVDYTAQRILVGKVTSTAKLEYIGSQPDVGLFYCEACDRGWDIKEELDNHNSQHMTCGLEGCTLSAHPKVIEKHIQQQHVTGLYKRITASYNPDDIAKWLTERKSRFPTQENIEKKQAQKEEMMARGESMPQNDHSNRANGGRGRRQFSNRGRGGRKRRHQNMRRNEKNDVIEKININHYSQAQDNPPDFQFCKTDKTWGDCWRGDLPQFPGTAAFPKIKEVMNTVKEEQFSDDEWQNSGNKEIIVEPTIKSQALASLSGMYASESDDDDLEQPPPAKKYKSCITTVKQEVDCNSNDKNSFVESNIENEQATHVKKSSSELAITITEKEDSDSAPEEVPVTHEDSFENYEATSKEFVKDSFENSKKIPEENAVNKHERSEQRMVSEKKSEHCKNEVNSKKGVPHYNTRFSQRRRRLTLLEKLLSREITHERNVILQCVRYVIQNNFLNER